MAQETSLMAYDKFKAEGKEESHEEVILRVLRTYGKLTAYGIGKRSKHKAKDKQGRLRDYVLSDVAVNRRIAKLRRDDRIQLVGRKKDTDGVTRNEYQLKK